MSLLFEEASLVVALSVPLPALLVVLLLLSSALGSQQPTLLFSLPSLQVQLLLLLLSTFLLTITLSQNLVLLPLLSRIPTILVGLASLLFLRVNSSLLLLLSPLAALFTSLLVLSLSVSLLLLSFSLSSLLFLCLPLLLLRSSALFVRLSALLLLLIVVASRLALLRLRLRLGLIIRFPFSLSPLVSVASALRAGNGIRAAEAHSNGSEGERHASNCFHNCLH